MSDLAEQQKKETAQAAIQWIQDEMILGVGTGSTVNYLISEIGQRVRLGFKITCIPTSIESANRLQLEGVPMRPLSDINAEFFPDLCLDGADEVDPRINLIKGRGGALLREKIVADASRRFIVLADESKLVRRLGEKSRLPVEVLPDAVGQVSRRLREIVSDPQLRQDYRTENGNAVLDCLLNKFPADLLELEKQINNIPGVIENGLFIQRAKLALIGTSQGVITLGPE